MDKNKSPENELIHRLIQILQDRTSDAGDPVAKNVGLEGRSGTLDLFEVIVEPTLPRDSSSITIKFTTVFFRKRSFCTVRLFLFHQKRHRGVPTAKRGKDRSKVEVYNDDSKMVKPRPLQELNVFTGGVKVRSRFFFKTEVDSWFIPPRMMILPFLIEFFTIPKSVVYC